MSNTRKFTEAATQEIAHIHQEQLELEDIMASVKRHLQDQIDDLVALGTEYTQAQTIHLDALNQILRSAQEKARAAALGFMLELQYIENNPDNWVE